MVKEQVKERRSQEEHFQKAIDDYNSLIEDLQFYLRQQRENRGLPVGVAAKVLGDTLVKVIFMAGELIEVLRPIVAERVNSGRD